MQAVILNYKNRWQITHGDIGMPDLNSENWLVQQKVSNYVQQLKNDGVDGIRWDAAKHVPAVGRLWLLEYGH